MASGGADPLIGRVVGGKMELLAPLGRGAMGKVYRAHHRPLDKVIAIKVLHQQATVSAAMAARFKAEARAASRLDHPNSLRILDFGEDGPDKLLYIAMELLDGVTLQSIIVREGQIPPERTVRIVGQICSALAAAHDQGVVHRDVKPANVILTRRQGDQGMIEDFVKVCDFGLAKVLDTDSEGSSSGPITQQGTVLGTPAYMSPEQAKGIKIDHRADLYSVGCILYRMLSGQKPFIADSGWAVSLKQISEKPRPLTEVAPEIAAPLAAVVHRTLEKRPADRYPNARALKAALYEAVGVSLSDDSDSVLPRAESTASAAFAEPSVELDPTVVPGEPSGVARPTGRGRLLAAVGGLAAVVGLGLALNGGEVTKVEPPVEPPAATEPAPPPSGPVSLTIVGAPEATQVSFEGKVLGFAPGPIKLQRTDRPMSLTFSSEDHEPLSRTIIPDRDLHLTVALRPILEPVPPPPKRRKTKTRTRKSPPSDQGGEKKKRDRHALENPFE